MRLVGLDLAQHPVHRGGVLVRGDSVKIMTQVFLCLFSVVQLKVEQSPVTAFFALQRQQSHQQVHDP